MIKKFLYQLGAACGILYVILMVVGHEVLIMSVQTPREGASAEQIAQYFANEVTSRTIAGAYLEFIGICCFVFFIGSLWSILRKAEGDAGVFSTVALGGGLLTAGIKLAGAFPIIAAASMAPEVVHPEILQMLIGMNDAAFHITFFTNAILLSATATIVIQTGVLPRWLGWTAAILALGLFSGAAVIWTFPFAFVPALLSLLWIAATSVALMRSLGKSITINDPSSTFLSAPTQR
jgi:hypothetical protein